jgi:hypothetical protein
LSAGAFVCGAFAMLCLRAGGTNARANAIGCAVFAALAWLTHGGVAFSLLALAPVIAWRFWRGEMRAWLPAAGVLLMLTVPWFAFQKLYDPPGNRLLKWHLAGQTTVDARGTWETLRDSYATAGSQKVALNKAENFAEQVRGDWRELFDLSAAKAAHRRTEEFAHTFRALTWWPVLALFALVLPRQRTSLGFRDLIPVVGWLMLTLVLWCLLMFGPATTVIHQGSYALMIGLFVVFSVMLERMGRGWLAAIAVLQAIVFATTWPRANATIHGPTAALPFVIAAGIVLAWFVGRAVFAAVPTHLASPDFARDAARPHAPSPFATRVAAWLASLRAWWRDPQLNVWVLAALAVLLALRKPHALHTPQLWAEDGSIFLMQADMHGVSSLAMPYMGYLHLLPRLIAWIAPRLLDPAWWPGFYNGVSFVIWVAVLGRFFSRRLNLPGKPWLVLAFFLGVNTGEVLFNITNLQWLTAFVLIQQAIIAPPMNQRERWGDLLMLAVVGLTGPFVAAFVPLFIWRWWRRRSWDNFAVLALLGACAGIQAWFVITTGPKFDYQSEPVRLFAMLPVIARRLIVWPVLGERIALGLPNAVVGALGGTILAGLLAWTLRPHPRRAVRAAIVAAFGLIMLASVFRTRPDTWAADNLIFGDRYFYIPRVLIAWLLIWEFNATPRFIAGFARMLCLLAVLVHARDYVLPAPKDYRWKDHCEPIRRGVRADIPTLPEGWTLEYHGRPSRAAR